jgi:hypothetical protein
MPILKIVPETKKFMNKKVYIAGKVTGEPYALVLNRFGNAELNLTALGYKVVNPIKIVNNSEADWKSAMKKCLSALLECDAIFLLPDWSKSKGAKLELSVALAAEIEVLTL